MKRTWFTLIELLVVIAIIAILAAMLLPALSAARERARFSNCSSKLKNAGMATFLYAQNNGEYLPYNYTNENYVFASFQAASIHPPFLLFTGGYTGVEPSSVITAATLAANYQQYRDAMAPLVQCPSDTQTWKFTSNTWYISYFYFMWKTIPGQLANSPTALEYRRWSMKDNPDNAIYADGIAYNYYAYGADNHPNYQHNVLNLGGSVYNINAKAIKTGSAFTSFTVSTINCYDNR
ncbi:hypothetical protein SDC9_122909 [bioreactor metagenome]|uniref:Type II secretion system protein G n=1 Tax=bioreactor metagenome TaxID=1076179 RepID=A0A645CG34_9ZZZZ